MSFTGRFDGMDGEKAKITDQRGPWYGYVGRGIDVSNIAVGATVEFEVEEVPNKDPAKRPYKRFVKITPVGQGAPPSVRPVAAAATRTVAAMPYNPGVPGNPAPQQAASFPADTRAEDIFIAGIVNRYVQATGDTSVAGITQAAFNAKDAFRLVQSNQRPVQQPAGNGSPVVNPPAGRFDDDTPF